MSGAAKAALLIPPYYSIFSSFMRLRICGSKGWLWGERSEPLFALWAVAARRAAPTNTEIRRARCKPRARREGGFAGAKRRTHGEAERDSRARS